MLEAYLLNHPWLPASLWMLLYTSDYYLTLWGARLYRRQSVYQYEGSYELTPDFQKDIDEQKPVSFTHVMWLLAGAIILLATGYLPGSKAVYGGFVGFFLTIEVAIHLRHIQGITSYRRLAGPNPEMSGHVTLSRASGYRRSAQELGGLAFLAFLGYVLTNDPILLGGAISLAYTSAQHLSHMRRCATSPTDIGERPDEAGDGTDVLTSAGSNDDHDR